MPEKPLSQVGREALASGHLLGGREGPHPQYRILHQVKAMESDGRGGFEPHFTVHYETPSGVQSYVKVPAHSYTPRNVHDQIAHELDLIERTHQLGSGPPPQHEHDQAAG